MHNNRFNPLPNFLQVVTSAFKQNWTRDPFDRIIVAQASINKSVLVSACTKSHFFKNALLNLMNYFLNFDSASLKTHQLLRVLLVQCRFSTF